MNSSKRRFIERGPSQFGLLIHGLDRRRGVDRSLYFRFKAHPDYGFEDTFALNSIGIPGKETIDFVDPTNSGWVIDMTSRTDGTRWRGVYDTEDRVGWIEPVVP